MHQMQWTLADGREISVVSFFVKNLAAGLQAGVSQIILEEDAKGIARRIWPEDPAEILKLSPAFPPAIGTQFVCMGMFVSGPPPNSQESASSLVIIWFQPALSSEFEEIALAGLSEIDWDQKAKPFSW